MPGWNLQSWHGLSQLVHAKTKSHKELCIPASKPIYNSSTALRFFFHPSQAAHFPFSNCACVEVPETLNRCTFSRFVWSVHWWLRPVLGPFKGVPWSTRVVFHGWFPWHFNDRILGCSNNRRSKSSQSSFYSSNMFQHAQSSMFQANMLNSLQRFMESESWYGEDMLISGPWDWLHHATRVTTPRLGHTQESVQCASGGVDTWCILMLQTNCLAAFKSNKNSSRDQKIVYSFQTLRECLRRSLRAHSFSLPTEIVFVDASVGLGTPGFAYTMSLLPLPYTN